MSWLSCSIGTIYSCYGFGAATIFNSSVKDLHGLIEESLSNVKQSVVVKDVKRLAAVLSVN